MSSTDASAQGFLERLNEFFSPPSVKKPLTVTGPEYPVPNANAEADAIARLPGLATRDSNRILLEARQLIDADVADPTRVRIVEELQDLVASNPDQFTWTNYQRWTSTRRLARELLGQLEGDSAALQPVRVNLKRAQLAEVAAASRRNPKQAVRSHLQSAWDAVRRDAGFPTSPTAGADQPQEPIEIAWPATGASASIVSSSPPVSLARWSQQTASRNWIDEITKLFEDRVERNQSVIPAAMPAISNDTVVWRTSIGLQAVSLKDGEVLWNIPLPDSHDSSQSTGTPAQRTFTFNIGNWRTNAGEESTFSQAVLSGSAGQRPVADDRKVYIVLDPSIHSQELSGRQNRFQAFQRGQTDLDLSANLLRAIDLQSGRTTWEIGGPALQDQFERPLAGTFFLGPPAVVGQTLYALVETRGEVQLKALNSKDGSEIWSQPLTATELAIDQDVDRRFWACTPTIVGGVAVCPTGAGWVCGVDIDGRELLWATRVAQPVSQGNRYNTYSLTSVDARWRSGATLLDGGSVWVFPPDAADPERASGNPNFYQLDLWTGEVLAANPRGSSLTPVGIADSGEGRFLLIAGSDGLVGYDLMMPFDNRERAPDWKFEVGNGSQLTGRPVLDGRVVHASVDGSELWTIDALTGKLLTRRPLDDEGHLANLMIVDGSLLSCGPTSLTRLFNETQVNDLPGDSVQRRLQIARVTGQEQAARKVLADWSSDDGASPIAPKEVAQFLRDAAATMAQAIEIRDPSAATVIAKLESIADLPKDRLPLERLRILVVEQNGNFDDAAIRLVKLASSPDLTKTYVDNAQVIGSGASTVAECRMDRWLAAAIARIWPRLSPSMREELTGTVAENATKASVETLAVFSGTGVGIDRFATLFSADQVDRLRRHFAAGTSDRISREALESQFAQPAETIGGVALTWDDMSFQTHVLSSATRPTSDVVVRIQSDDEHRRFDGLHLRLSRQLQTVFVVEISTGRVIASLPLASRKRIFYSGDTTAWSDADMLFVADLGRLHAYRVADWSHAWSIDLGDETPFYRTEEDSAGVLHPARDFVDEASLRFSAVVAFGFDAVVTRVRSTISAVSRFDGSELWKRDLANDESILGVVDDMLVVRSASEWRLVSLLDGSTRRLEMDAKPRLFAATIEDSIFTIDPDGYSGPVQLCRWKISATQDGYSGQLDGQFQIDNNKNVALLDTGHVLLVDEAGQTELFDLRTFRSTLKQNIEALAAEAVHNGNVGYVVSQGQLFVYSDVQYSPARAFDVEGGLARAISGHLAAIDIATGTLMWQIDDVHGNLLWGESHDTPALIFLKRDREIVGGSPITEFQLRAISKQTGKTLFETAPSLSDSHMRTVRFDPNNQTLEFVMMQSRVRVMASKRTKDK